MKPAFALAFIAAAAAVVSAPVPGLAPAKAQQTATKRPDLAKPGTAFGKDSPTRNNWQATIARTERGYLIGNPKAKSTMIEFISYTCPHCADFAGEGENGLDLTLVSPGKMSLEVRSFIRNPLDLAASLLVACGPVSGFKDRHRLLMSTQNTWLEKARNAPRSQLEVWFRADADARVHAASALGLIDMLAKGGQSRSELTACLMDDKAALKLIDDSDADRKDFGVPGTPSFALDGKLLPNVHNWQALYPVLSAHFTPAPTGQP